MKRNVTENFDRPVIRLLPWVFIVVTLLSAGNINAESLIKSKYLAKQSVQIIKGIS